MKTNLKNSKFAERVAARRAQNGRRGLRRRPPRWLHPVGLERMYLNNLVGRVELLEQEVMARLVKRLPQLVAQAEVSLDVRQDDFVDDIKAIMAALSVGITAIYGDIEDYAYGVGLQVANFNAEQYKRVIKSTLGVDPFINDSFLQQRLKVFAAQNATLIQSIPRELLKDVEGVVLRGLTNGESVATMQRDIQARFKVSKARARLIARDQTGKLNAQLTEVRQERIGVNEYIWNSADDERVRDSHKVLDGMVCQWDNPATYRRPGSKELLQRSSIGGYVGAPGSDYQCRCFPEPILEDLIDGSA